MRRRSPDTRRFDDRRDAGRQLAAALARRDYEHPVVIALPRGGVPVAAEVAARLDAPLDVLIVRKLGWPQHPELGIGAIAQGGLEVRNDPLIASLGITEEELARVTATEQAEVDRRARRYRGDRPAAPVEGRTAIVVDDGLATGFTARAALDIVRARHPAKVVLAVPVAPSETVDAMRDRADEVVCLRTPTHFMAIGRWYADFTQVGDDEVAALLARHGSGHAAAESSGTPRRHQTRDVRIPADGTRLPGTLSVPPDPIGMVVFAHGSGSSRQSPRNTAVARTLNAAGLATLLFDLLDANEAADRNNVFDIGLLANRLDTATRWLESQPEAAGLPVGYFGASTGAAAALVAAAWRPAVAAVVSRGGRPDLARTLGQVEAPTLLIVGGRDEPVLDLNTSALTQLGHGSRLEVVPGATHLFSEPGALERVAELAKDWFTTHLSPADGTGDPARSEPAVSNRPPASGA
ncbi:MAG TPA: phosphoribosyltransferase family protein [Euzebyales bacterium]|nr:phosphoribosyltransferase family protein [Euzebyales bacterium]